MGKIIGESFENYVQEQIATRQSKLGNISNQDNDYHTWVTNRQPWIRMCSSANILPSKVTELGLPEQYGGNGLAKNYILYGGVAKTDVIEGNESLSLRGGISNTLNRVNLSNLNSYGFNSSNEFGYDPMPMIESLTITPKNRGSLTEAKIKIRCFNVDQFNILETLYLRLKYSILIEWGNTVYYDNNDELITTPSDTVYQEFLKGENINKNSILKKIETQRKNSFGNYDGFFGWVTNFNWSLDQEGGYDIEVSAVTIGDIIESISATESPSSPSATNLASGLTAEYSTPTSEDTYPDSALGNILFSFKNTLTNNEPFENAKLHTFGGLGPSRYASLNGENIKSTIINDKLNLNIVNVEDPGDEWFAKDEFINIDAQQAMYANPSDEITNKVFALAIQKDPPPERFVGENEVDYAARLQAEGYTSLNIDAQSVQGVGEYTGPVDALGNPLDTGQNLQDTTDPTLVNGGLLVTRNDKNLIINDKIDEILAQGIRGKKFSNPTPSYIKLGALLRIIQDLIYVRDQNGYALNKFYSRYDDNYCFNPERMLISLDPSICFIPHSFWDVAEGDQNNGWLTFSEGDFYTEDENDNRSYTMHIYVNVDYVLNTLEDNKNPDTGESSIIDCLDSILKGINNACGNVINLSLFYEESENTYYVIDENIPFSRGKTVTRFNVSSLKENLGSFVKNIDIKCEIPPSLAKTIAIGAQASGNSASESLPFANWNKGIRDRIINSKFTVSQPDSKLTSTDSITQFQTDLLVTYFSDSTKDMIPRYKKIMDNYIRNKKGTFIPINLSLGMDGISGIKIFQAYSITDKYLPKNYKDNILFITKGISHTVNRQEWTTNIEGLSIPKPSGAIQYSLTKTKTSSNNNSSSSGSSANPSEAYLNPPPLSTSPLPRIEPSQLSYSDEILKEIKTSEGFRDYAYDDKNPDVKNPSSVIGKITIGYGSTKYFTPVTITRGGQQIQVSKGSEIKIGDTITESEAEKLLIESLQGFIDPIKNVGVALTQNEFDALLSLVYNAGGGILNKLGISSYLKSGDYMAAAGQFWKVRKSGGDILKGLEKRRGREETLYLTDNPDYDPSTYKRNKST